MMNTIPSIFNEHQINMTILGGRRNAPPKPGAVDVVLLDRGTNPYRAPVLQSLLKCGFEHIISVESYKQENYNLSNLAKEFPQARFIAPLEPLSTGDMVNVGIGECESDYVLVLWNDMRVGTASFSKTNVSRLYEDGVFCTVPRLYTNDKNPLTSRFFPDMHNGMFRIMPESVIEDGAPSFYPFDFAGIYRRERFMAIGGYDYTIRSPYWQNLDLAARAWLWGERIRLSPGFHILYDGEPYAEDVTVTLDYLRFYLKNIAPVFEVDHAGIPLGSFWNFRSKSTLGLVDSWILFKTARCWVDKNKFRFKSDAVRLVEGWEVARES